MVEAEKFRLLVASLLCGLLAGCATETFTAETAPEYMVVRDRAPFYRYGPAQPGPPDARLDLDNRVRLLRREFGFSLVQIGTLQTGYVANEMIAPAPPRRAYAIAVERAPEEPARASNRPYTGPIVDDAPLPDLDEAPLDGPQNSVEDLPLITDDVMPTELTAPVPAE